MTIFLFASAARSDGASDSQSSNTAQIVDAEVLDNGLSAASAFSQPDGRFGAFAISRNAGPGANVSTQATFSSGYRISNRSSEVALSLAINFSLEGKLIGAKGGPPPLDFAAVSISFSGTVRAGSSIIRQDGTVSNAASSRVPARFTGIFENAPGVTSPSASDTLFDLPIGFRTAKASEGQITLSLVVSAATLRALGEPNLASADFAKTVKLDSITVADAIAPGDMAGLKLTLETGYEMRIMPQVAGSSSSGTEGNDQLVGTPLDDALDGKGGDDTITGLLQNDMLIGGTGNDTLLGNQGDDIIYGDEGDDTLFGNEGTDYLFGDAGRDRFVFDIGSRFNRSVIGVDQISDFQQGADKIVLDRSTFTALKKLSFKSVKNVSKAQKSAAQIVYIRQTGSLFYNQNGKQAGFGKGGQFADLSDGLALVKQDLAVIA